MNGAVFKTVSETARAGSGRFDSYTPPPIRQSAVSSEQEKLASRSPNVASSQARVDKEFATSARLTLLHLSGIPSHRIVGFRSPADPSFSLMTAHC